MITTFSRLYQVDVYILIQCSHLDTMPNVGIKVDGILAAGTFNGTDVNLLPYFTGELASSNRGGDKGVAINFLDGGAAEPLMKNMPANDNTSMQ